jgi:hypothetical protein
MAKHWVGVTLLFAMLILSLNASLNSLRMLVVVVMSLAAGRRIITISSTQRETMLYEPEGEGVEGI